MALEEEFDVTVAGGGARGHRDRRPGLRPGHRQALSPDHGRPTGRRVAVTGLGVVAPCGIGRDAFWEGLLGPGPARGRAPRSHGLRPEPVVRQPEGGPPRRPLRAVRHRRRRRGVRRRPADDRRRPGPHRRRSSAPASAACTRSRSQIVVRAREGRAPGVAVPRADDDGQRRRRRRSRCATACRARARRSCTACAAGTHAIGNAARLDRLRVAATRSSPAAPRRPARPPSVAGFTNMTALSTQRRLAARSTSTATASSWPRAPAVLSSRSGSTPCARGATILAEVLGGGQQRRRPPHHRPVARRRRRGGVHGAGARRRRARRPATSPTSTPTAPRRRSTTPPRPRPSRKVFGDARPARHVDQGRHRPRPRRRRRPRGGRRAPVDASTG